MNVRLTDAQKIKVLNANDVYDIMRQVLLRERKIDRNKEHFWIVCLAHNNRILLIELVSLGSVTTTVVEPMEVFSFALQKRAVQIILVHNHPSGELRPSTADHSLTEQMAAIGRFIKVPVIDHLIISEEGFYSFAHEGLMARMAADNRYDLTFAGVDSLLIQMKEMEKAQKREMTKAKKEIAKKALEEGLSVEQVVKISGLTRKQIEGLS